MPTVRYTTVNGEVIAEKRGGVRKHYVPDPLGSTAALLDNTQTQTDTFAYWPYGESQSRTGTTPTPFQFVGTLGYYRDSANRDYVRARYLDVAKGRWLTQDPLGFDGGDWNLYRYVLNKPVDLRDTTGKYTTVGCTNKRKRLIRKAIDDLCVRLKYLSLLPANFPGLACLKSRCGLASGGHGVVITCGVRCLDPTNCGQTDVNTPRQGIDLCEPNAWKQSECACLGNTILHEMVHSCIGDPKEKHTYECEDLLYGPQKPPCPS